MLLNLAPLALAPLLLKGVAIGLLVWICLPHVILALGWKPRWRIGGGPEDLAPEESDPVYADLYRQLTALEFEPLGFYYESIPFGPRFQVAMFGSRRLDCYASLSRLTRYDEVRLRFLSVFHGGGVILTKNDETVEEQRGDYLRQGVYTSSAEETLRLHLAAVERYRVVGHQECPGGTLGNRLLAADVFYGNAQVVSQMRRNFAEVAKTQITLVLGLAGIAWTIFGGQSPVPWMVLAMSCLGWKLLLDHQLRRYAHRPSRPEPLRPSGECVLCSWPAKLLRLLGRRNADSGCSTLPRQTP
jgi:hypothetical protein